MYYNCKKHQYIESYFIPKAKTDKPANVDTLHNIVQKHSKDKTVFVHVGLSDIKSIFHCNPYELLLDVLEEHFESILAPGFTPSFRKTGIYHKSYSKPEYGAFAKLFLEDADYRTDDALHSILVKGDYRFDDCEHHDSFSRQGCWAKLDQDNVLIMDIGLPWYLTTQHHFIEHYYDVPYNLEKKYEGRIYYDDFKNAQIVQKSYSYDYSKTKRNFIKLESYLKSVGALEKHDINGLKIFLFRARDVRKALEPKIKKDKYYLVV